MKSCQILGLLLLSAHIVLGALNTNSSTATMKVYETGAAKLTAYTDVPGHTNSVIKGYPSRAKSDIYEIWVRSAATDNVWVQCFANMTYNRGLEMPIIPEYESAGSSHAYWKITAGWTHTYANIEMSTNSPVEVEIRKIGSTLLNSSNVIFKSAVHPAHKVSSQSNYLGRVYFTITNPCQVAIDINGQMDDHNAAFPTNTPGGAMPGKPPVHTVALYANPIMAKPVASATNTIVTVTPNQSSPTNPLYTVQPNPATYDTLVFAPGVHHIGPGFKVHPGKSYYIPGDAILYGNLNNEGVSQGSYRCTGDRINIYGYGTICGIVIPHYQNRTADDTANGTPNPEYPEYLGWSDPKDADVGIRIEQAWDTRITGVTVADPANFNTKFDVFGGRVNDQSLVSWVKLHSWRVNGDGCGGYVKIEDSLIRASDDNTYIRDWRRRCTFWKDSNANIFRFINYVAGGLEDCDILYARFRFEGGAGNVFDFVGYSGSQSPVLTFKNIRFHDKLCNPRCIITLEPTTQAFTNATFENVSFFTPLNNQLSEIIGGPSARYTGRVMFTNVTFQNGLDGSSPVRLTRANYTNYFTTSAYVDPSIFEPTTLMGSYTLTTSGPNGSIALNPPGGTYPTGTVVTVTATPNSGFSFASWSGDLAGSLNPATITMNANKSVTANFTPDIESVPWVVNFNGLATGTTNQGAPTTWTATRGGTFRVNGNRLEVNGGGGEGVFTTGVINISNRTVNVSLDVLGAGGLDVGEDYVRLYIKVNGGAETLVSGVTGPQVAATTWTTNGITGTNLQVVIRTLVTAASEYYYLDNLQVTNLPVTVPTYTLTTGTTNGTIMLNPPGGFYTYGTVVTVTANPNGGYAFDSWGGNLAGSVNPTTITMTGNKSVTANFALRPLVAAIRLIGSGPGFEISASNLEPTWAYELQGKTGYTLPWDTVSGSLRSNVTVAVWTNSPLPGEPTKFFRVIKRD